MAIKYIVLHMGYVESSSATGLILENQTGEELSKTEALKNLASALFVKFLCDHEYDLSPRRYKTCCNKTVEADHDAKFCMTCGSSFQSKKMRKGQFISFVSQLVSTDADDWGEDINGWWPWVSVTDVMKNATVEEVLEIQESGAEVVTEFLSPDLIPEQYRSTVESWRNEYVRPNVVSLLTKVKK